MEVAEIHDVAACTGTKNQPQDEILNSCGIHPLLIPHVIKAMLDFQRLSLYDLKSFRLVCTDWSTLATTVLSKKCRITLNGRSGMKKFTKKFMTGQYIPTREFKLIECGEDMEDFMTDFGPLFDWPGLEIESLILKNENVVPQYFYKNCYGQRLMDGLSILLKKIANLKHLTFQYWDFRSGYHENQNDRNIFEGVIEKGSKIKSLSLNNCLLSDGAALVLLPTFNKLFSKLDTIDLSNKDRNESSFCTNILLETLVRSFTWTIIKTLKIPELNTEVILRLNQTDIKLKHFHADEMWMWKTSIRAWTEFLTQQNELESFSINQFGNSYGPIDYKIPRMEKLNRLHIGRYGLRYITERYQIFENCLNLKDLIVGCLPADMIFTNHQITSLTLENPDAYYSGWFEDLPRVSKEFVGLKYLTIKLAGSLDRNSVIKLSKIFPDLLDLKIIF